MWINRSSKSPQTNLLDEILLAFISQLACVYILSHCISVLLGPLYACIFSDATTSLGRTVVPFRVYYVMFAYNETLE